MPHIGPRGPDRSGGGRTGGGDTVEDAVHAARTGDAGLARTAHDAFTTAMSTTFLVGAGGVLAAAVLALLVLRDRGPAVLESAPEAEPVDA